MIQHPVTDSFEDFLGSEEFYDLSQNYRHTPFVDQSDTSAAWELMKRRLVEEHHKANLTAWEAIYEFQRRFLIISNAVRGAQRFIDGRQHHGRKQNTAGKEVKE